jgi:hypothetical protein
MKNVRRWEETQETEVEFWAGIARQDFCVLRVLADNSEKAPLLQPHLKPNTRNALEVGSGPFGLGVIGYLPEIPFRIAMDPLDPTRMDANDPPVRVYRDTTKIHAPHRRLLRRDSDAEWKFRSRYLLQYD